jgi:hypothetical protein
MTASTVPLGLIGGGIAVSDLLASREASTAGPDGRWLPVSAAPTLAALYTAATGDAPPADDDALRAWATDYWQREEALAAAVTHAMYQARSLAENWRAYLGDAAADLLPQALGLDAAAAAEVLGGTMDDDLVVGRGRDYAALPVWHAALAPTRLASSLASQARRTFAHRAAAETWMAATHGALGGRAPLAALAAGDLWPVLRALAAEPAELPPAPLPDRPEAPADEELDDIRRDGRFVLGPAHRLNGEMLRHMTDKLDAPSLRIGHALRLTCMWCHTPEQIAERTRYRAERREDLDQEVYAYRRDHGRLHLDIAWALASARWWLALAPTELEALVADGGAPVPLLTWATPGSGADQLDFPTWCRMEDVDGLAVALELASGGNQEAAHARMAAPVSNRGRAGAPSAAAMLRAGDLEPLHAAFQTQNWGRKWRDWTTAEERARRVAAAAAERARADGMLAQVLAAAAGRDATAMNARLARARQVTGAPTNAAAILALLDGLAESAGDADPADRPT